MTNNQNSSREPLKTGPQEVKKSETPSTENTSKDTTPTETEKVSSVR